jgi:hypothetical protein
MYDANVLADSVKPNGDRITTLRVTFPRFILAELNTHRMLSRNSASSRAIPPERLIQRVKEDPFVPETFNKRVKGMGVGQALNDYDANLARSLWLEARDAAVVGADALNVLGVDKSRVNRLLEPFLWHTAIVTATEWSNFFALRDHPAAQPEFRKLARLMREAMDASTPEEISYGDWHLPLLRPNELIAARNAKGHDNRREWAMISAGRCFTVSYDRDPINEDATASYARCVGGTQSGHWSPLEHPAMAVKGHARIGNFYGYCQLRKIFPGESDFRTIIDATSTGVPEPASAS